MRLKGSPDKSLSNLASGLLLSVLLLLGSCRRSSREAQTIALITPLTTSELWKSVHAGVVHASVDNGFRWYWNAPTHENDPERQLELVDRQLSLGIAGLVLVPAHSSVLIEAVRQTQQSNVPLVIAGERLAIPLDNKTGSVSTDARKAGMLAGMLASQPPGEHGDVAVVGVNRASTDVLERLAGFEDMIHSASGRRVVLKLDGAVGPGGQSQADLLRMVANGAAGQLVFSVSPAATRAVYATLREAGLLGQVSLIGCGQDPELYPALRNGEIRGLIAENAYRIGLESATMLIAVRKQQAPLRHLVLDPLVLTREDIDLPDTKLSLHPYTGFDR